MQMGGKEYEINIRVDEYQGSVEAAAEPSILVIPPDGVVRWSMDRYSANVYPPDQTKPGFSISASSSHLDLKPASGTSLVAVALSESVKVGAMAVVIFDP